MSDSASDELPELTLSLRSIGSRRGEPDESTAIQDEQDRFFAPLLDGRRVAAAALSRSQIVAAFEARRLTALIDATMRAFAAERFGTRAPARRAFEAELFEIIDALRSSLQVLGAVAEGTAAPPNAAIHDEQWTLWLAQLRVVFHVADSCWPPLRRVLTSSPRTTAVSGRWSFPSRGDRRR